MFEKLDIFSDFSSVLKIGSEKLKVFVFEDISIIQRYNSISLAKKIVW